MRAAEMRRSKVIIAKYEGEVDVKVLLEALRNAHSASRLAPFYNLDEVENFAALFVEYWTNSTGILYQERSEKKSKDSIMFLADVANSISQEKKNAIVTLLLNYLKKNKVDSLSFSLLFKTIYIFNSTNPYACVQNLRALFPALVALDTDLNLSGYRAPHSSDDLDNFNFDKLVYKLRNLPIKRESPLDEASYDFLENLTFYQALKLAEPDISGKSSVQATLKNLLLQVHVEYFRKNMTLDKSCFQKAINQLLIATQAPCSSEGLSNLAMLAAVITRSALSYEYDEERNRQLTMALAKTPFSLMPDNDKTLSIIDNLLSDITAVNKIGIISLELKINLFILSASSSQEAIKRIDLVLEGIHKSRNIAGISTINLDMLSQRISSYRETYTNSQSTRELFTTMFHPTSTSISHLSELPTNATATAPVGQADKGTKPHS
jgi:hypothetical protein